MLTDIAEILANIGICLIFVGMGYLIRWIQDKRQWKHEYHLKLRKK